MSPNGVILTFASAPRTERPPLSKSPSSQSNNPDQHADVATRPCHLRVTVPFEIGLCIRGRRYQLKLGQADLAARVGVGRQWIMACESGKGSVELALVLKTLSALGLDLVVVDRDPPEWTVPLTRAAGTAARPYAKARAWRNAGRLPKG